jgi:hypothetical protein
MFGDFLNTDNIPLHSSSSIPVIDKPELSNLSDGNPALGSTIPTSSMVENSSNIGAAATGTVVRSTLTICTSNPFTCFGIAVAFLAILLVPAALDTLFETTAGIKLTAAWNLNSGVFLPSGSPASFTQQLISTIETIAQSRKSRYAKESTEHQTRIAALEKAYSDKVRGGGDESDFVYVDDSLDSFKEFLNRFSGPEISPENVEKIVDIMIFGSSI